MLKLYTMDGAGKLRSPSPFAWKAEAALKLAGVPFVKENVADFAKMPYGKIPVLQDGDTLIPGSSHILRHLKHRYGFDLDKNLTTEQKAVGEAFRRMAEEHLYWNGVYNRFIDPVGQAFMKKAMFGGMPEAEAEAAFAATAQNAMNQMIGHGIGRHPQAEIYAFGKGGLDAISDYLADKAYFFGSEITSVDLSLAPITAGLILTPIDTEIALYARTKTNLTAYIERFDNAVFGS